MTRKLRAWHDKLLRAESPICIVGYGLNSEAGMPHFRDLIQGVWSHHDAQLNPLNSEENYRRIMNWYSCRKVHIRSNRHSLIYQSLRDLKMVMQLTVATQCIDGLAGLNGVQVEYELFGNVFQAKCHACRHEDEFFPIEGDMASVVCPICGGRYFPNVSMFGWNAREATHSELIHKLAGSDCILMVGADKALLPFIQPEVWRRHNQLLLRISKGQISVLDSGEKLVISAREIAGHLKDQKIESELIDKIEKGEGKVGFDEMLRLICAFFGK